MYFVTQELTDKAQAMVDKTWDNFIVKKRKPSIVVFQYEDDEPESRCQYKFGLLRCAFAIHLTPAQLEVAHAIESKPAHEVINQLFAAGDDTFAGLGMFSDALQQAHDDAAAPYDNPATPSEFRSDLRTNLHILCNRYELTYPGDARG